MQGVLKLNVKLRCQKVNVIDVSKQRLGTVAQRNAGTGGNLGIRRKIMHVPTLPLAQPHPMSRRARQLYLSGCVL
jgi:hypothetical protein